MKHNAWGRGSFVAGLLLTAACATLFSRGSQSHDVIKFPHQRHQQANVECLVCHESVYEETQLGAALLPPEKKCLECHNEQKANGHCEYCHLNKDNPRTYEKKEIRLAMEHAKHIELTQESCSTCHAKLSEPGDSKRPVPPMSTCLGCHEHNQQYTDGTCNNCHVDLTRFALWPITSFSHESNYTRVHSKDAQTKGGQACGQCHDQRFCTDCHAQTVAAPVAVKYVERVDRKFIHWGDYLTRHSVEARAETINVCQKCHGQTFCDSCHQAQGLSGSSAVRVNPHPPGFKTVGAANFHGVEARRDIASCATCHDQGAASNCVQCHAEGGEGGNPHPPSWSRKHSKSEIAKNSMCLACHR